MMLSSEGNRARMPHPHNVIAGNGSSMNQCSTTPSAKSVETRVRLTTSNGVAATSTTRWIMITRTAVASVTDIGKKALTGLRAKKWRKLASFFPSPGFVEEMMTIFLATELTEGAAQPMEDERIETRWFTKKELRELLRTNRIVDAKTMIGFLYWDRL